MCWPHRRVGQHPTDPPQDQAPFQGTPVGMWSIGQNVTCGFTVNSWAWLVLGSCSCRQPEVVQKQKRHQDLLWQGPGPKAPGVEGDPSGTSTFLFDTCSSPVAI